MTSPRHTLSLPRSLPEQVGPLSCALRCCFFMGRRLSCLLMFNGWLFCASLVSRRFRNKLLGARRSSAMAPPTLIDSWRCFRRKQGSPVSDWTRPPVSDGTRPPVSDWTQYAHRRAVGVFGEVTRQYTCVFYRKSQESTCEYELFDAQLFPLFEPLAL